MTDLRCRAWVDTSAASFDSTPFYFVSFAFDPWVDLLATHPESQTIGPFLSLSDPTKTGFWLNLYFAARTGTFEDALERIGLESALWIGVEPDPDCPPNLDLDRFFTAAGSPISDLTANWSEAAAAAHWTAGGDNG
jgi:hypothetical protein